MAQNDKTVSLSDMTIALRTELDAMMAHLEASGKEAILELEKAEIELTFGVEREAGGKGGVSFKVFGIGFDAGGNASHGSAITQKMKLSLKPIPGGSIGVALE